MLTRAWWKESIIYQIYPRSFQDSNGDGIGDLKGIINRLEHIKNVGADVIWLCPVYQSPNDDNGYDISDYYAIMDEFGTMADFDELLDKAHQLGLKIIMDLVVNHSSDEHVWFVESRSSKDNPKRNYYIWHPGQDGNPPNNWQSFFGGSAWEKDPNTGEYYLHLFTKKQPDLNWDNRSVRNDIYQMMRFWLDKGIDGFRMDVISLISKRSLENTSHTDFIETIANDYANGPMVHTYLQEMNREVLRHYNVVTVGEGPGITIDHALDYVQDRRKELSMIFHFDHMFIDHGPNGKFDPQPMDWQKVKKIFCDWDEKLKMGGWSSIFLGNHDFPRIVSRFGDDGTYHEQSAKAVATLLLTMRGTPYIYQGDEIGMTNVAFDSLEDYRDVETRNAAESARKHGLSDTEFLRAVHSQGRDNARTPFQWEATPNAGFSTGNPWIKVNPNYKNINLKTQLNNPDSIYNFYRKAIQLRRNYDVLVYGELEPIDLSHPSVFAYHRYDHDAHLLVLINHTSQITAISLVEETPALVQVLLNNYPVMPKVKGNRYELQPWQAVVLEMPLHK